MWKRRAQNPHDLRLTDKEWRLVYNELKNRLLVDLGAELIEERVPLDDGEALEEKFQ